MRSNTLALVAVVLAGGNAVAGPVVVEIPEEASVRTALVAIGDVTKVTGGTVADRAAVSRLDLAEIPARDAVTTVTRRYIETRLHLAGFDPSRVTVVGADRLTVTPARRPVTPNEIVTAARDELTRLLPAPPGAVKIDLVQPVGVALPEIPVADQLTITAKPRTKVTGQGRVQMDVVVSSGGERLIALGVYFEVKPVGASSAGSEPPPVATGGVAPPPPTGDVLVRARQRVSMTARIGEVKVTAVGEAQQDGRAGQTILVQNIDSKKLVSAKVTGPGAVEVDLGGAP